MMRNSMKSKTKTIQKQKKDVPQQISKSVTQKRRGRPHKNLPIEVLPKEESCSLKHSKSAGISTDDSSSNHVMTEEISQNSLVDVSTKLRPISDFNQFLEVPIIRPTIEEFNDPFRLIANLYLKGYDKQGVVKIIPPPEWKPDFQFSKIQSKVNTRVQVVNKLSKGKPFEQNEEGFTYKEYQQYAEKFQKKYDYQTEERFIEKERLNEYEFWSIVEFPHLFKDVEVEYAADLPSQKYGSAFAEQPTKHDKISYLHSFNLKNINRSHNSLFQFIKNGGDISGITTPWVYLGMLYASFCFHVEDLYMYALNYLHMGAPKTWYTIPADYKEKFEELYQEKYKDIFQKNPAVLHHLNLQLCPAEAVKRGIPVYRTDQKAGEFIVTFPKVYHGGFSHGFNCGEAVNIVTPEWIKFYKEAKFDYARKGFQKKVSFSLAWVLVSIIQNLQDSSFDKVTLQNILHEWQEIEKEELHKRKDLINIYGKKLKIYEFANKNEKYDRHVCKICSGYCYLSYIYCNKCFTQGCPAHIAPCGCIESTISLFIRFNEKEMQQFGQIVKDTIKNNF
ncbi:JmjC domain protein (macronuclear) [Tetrahymena thermophila SB210]|uniref:JmjC domain protein n=1 Tax=Tetrahymena thermophila (strain SB210) TaxID=312017 RepID=X1W3S8_TETTS|nr:JmjC domain protein [Tetrahymena thermophila SB210]EAS03798.2 JmjC domain protein [Tetrahymena thermophila SB210]|eukprot:XP_001024043.2 JmjC domain protein [Tetrahymena thermophila SB210]